MADLPLHEVTSDATTITLGWEPVGNLGYRFSRSAGAGKFSHTWDSSRSSARFSKDSDWYKVEAMGVAAAGSYPPPPPPPPPPLAATPRFGISTGAEIVVNSIADRNRELDAIKAINAQMVRFDHWGDNRSNDVADACWDRGMVPMLTIFGTDRSPRTDPGTLAGQVATRNKNRPTRIYEICNEPDLNGWTPSVYAPFAKAACNQILTADPGATIWCGGFFKGNDQAGKTPPDFAQALCNAGVQFHVFSGHFFDDDPAWNDPRNGWHYAAQVRAILDANGRSNVPIVSSETHCGGTDAQQASAVQSRMQQVKDGKVAATCFYRMRPQGDRPDFALLRSDWSERPACTTFRNMVSS